VSGVVVPQESHHKVGGSFLMELPWKEITLEDKTMKKILLLLSMGIMFFFANLANAETVKESLQDVPRISAKLAYMKFQSGTAFLIDAMDPEAFARKHILGAINIPYGSSKNPETLEKLVSGLPIDKEIIIY
jgi:Rhodanese-like domain